MDDIRREVTAQIQSNVMRDRMTAWLWLRKNDSVVVLTAGMHEEHIDESGIETHLRFGRERAAAGADRATAR